jgi:hypothetical protein
MVFQVKISGLWLQKLVCCSMGDLGADRPAGGSLCALACICIITPSGSEKFVVSPRILGLDTGGRSSPVPAMQKRHADVHNFLKRREGEGGRAGTPEFTASRRSAARASALGGETVVQNGRCGVFLGAGRRIGLACAGRTVMVSMEIPGRLRRVVFRRRQGLDDSPDEPGNSVTFRVHNIKDSKLVFLFWSGARSKRHHSQWWRGFARILSLLTYKQ